ncbi:DUF742 domain-containing protein [Lentzea kentuckyensis]|uniref:DUF742 domain-containing protein n=1 Tax=Lentzea kentuckyensis TaxID=360086 RepID=UPI000A3C2A0B|nr:DUF742 domain-containing protein [Lentzea kentuckyensis]
MNIEDPHRLPSPWFEPATDSPPDPRGTVESEVDELVVRPFVVTGGRTRPLCADLRLETLVQAPPAALSAPLWFEEHAIVRLCQRPRSTAEIASALGVPIGVARVVIGDLAAARHVSITESGELPLATIERMRDLVRAL